MMPCSKSTRRRAIAASASTLQIRRHFAAFCCERRGKDRFENVRRKKADDRDRNAVAGEVIGFILIVRQHIRSVISRRVYLSRFRRYGWDPPCHYDVDIGPH